MLPKTLQFYLFLLANCFQNGATVHSPYESKQSHLLPATNSDNEGYTAQQSVYNGYRFYEQNLPGNSNYQTLYPYYYTPPYQAQQPSQLWSGLPIVIEDNIQQQQQTSTNIPPIFYEQQSTGVVGELLPFRHRNSPQVITPTIYSPQSTTRTATQFNFNNHNNNNNNIIYHRDIRHHIDATPQTQSQQTQQQNIISLNNQLQKQQQQQQHQLLEEQQQQEEEKGEQFYANTNTKTNLHYNGISNDSNSPRKDDNKSDYYREQFKRYLENNPHRIKPVYQ